VKSLYSARDVAEMFGLQESRVRYWAQTGFVGPSEKLGGKAAYSFQDLIGVKAAKELLDRGMTVQRARKNLEALRQQLPGVSRPLSQLRIVSDGDRLLVVGDGAPFEPLSGQLVLDFATGTLEGQVAALPEPVEKPPADPRADSAYAWFLDGAACEARGDDDQALIAYQRALDGDPALAAAHTNIGNLLFRRGERGDARAHYQAALELDPEQPEARFNLGNLYDELGEPERAVSEWYRVVAACPEFADAHFNLAVALAERGAVDTARGHLTRYLELDGEGEWAARARALLENLNG
jgi:tetratricopeptide (TPR) repeat protein